MKNNDLEKCIGVWLDHEKAYFIHPGKSTDSIIKVSSNIQPHPRIPGEAATGIRLGNYRSSNNEYSKHKKEQEHLKQYYDTLLSRLTSFDYVFLLGPSTAKNEFGNYIRKHKPTHALVVEAREAGEMTEGQMMAEVSEHFLERNT